MSGPLAKHIARQTKIRRTVVLRDGLVCGICGRPITSKRYHIDHTCPRSVCGEVVDTSGLQVAHVSCNLRKGARTGIRTSKK